jgi:hypothetical protein
VIYRHILLIRSYFSIITDIDLTETKNKAENDYFAAGLSFMRAAKLKLVGNIELPLGKNVSFCGRKNLFLGCVWLRIIKLYSAHTEI